jgi:similar to stage IV sporulation protein
MILTRLWNYLRGYVIILVKGYFFEKFINICTNRQIFLWDVKRASDENVLVKMSIKGFKKIRPVAKKADCRIKIIKKTGMPFLINRYRKRKTFVIGAAMFVLIIYIMSSFIWKVEVTGFDKLEKEYIESVLASHGVKPGVLKYGINTDNLANAMMMEIDELAWISVTLRGTRIKVEIAEVKKAPLLVQRDIPCDIAAKSDGIIKSVIVKDGISLVKAGDIVVKGQILVTGLIPTNNEEESVRLVHSIAEITARTWYESSEKINRNITETVKTGRVKEHYCMGLSDMEIVVYTPKIKFMEYEIITIKKDVKIGRHFVLPISLITKRYYELEKTDRNLDIEEAKQFAINVAYEEAKSIIPQGARIIQKTARLTCEGDICTKATVVIECEEELGIEKKLTAAQ